MSAERELLKEIMSYFAKGDITIRKFENSSDIAETFHTAQELLAQPEQEQEPVAWRTYRVVTDDWQYHSFPYGLDLTCQPLYLTPQKREPLSESEIAVIWGDSDYDVAVVRRIEKAHGIGGVK